MISKQKMISWFLLLNVCITFYVNAEDESYDEVVSLGYGCQVAWQLEANGIRKLAYPFDWFHTPMLSLLNFISNKGVYFLDADKIAIIGPYAGDPSRFHVIDLVYGIISYHDFMVSPPFANYTEVKGKYQRRIKRFFSLLNSNQKILFVRQGSSRSEIERLDELLHTLYPNLSYTILCVNESDEYKKSWKLERIQNFYLPDTPGIWTGDVIKWNEVLSQFSLTPTSQPRSLEEAW